MTQLEFSYSSLITDKDGEENTDAGLISFNIDFTQEPASSDFQRSCYAIAMEEVTAVLADKYGESIFEQMPDITLKISGLTIS
jgi:hypothetical protein